MKLSVLTLTVLPTILATSIVSTAEPAGTRRPTADAIFTEPRDSALTQILFSLGDVVAFQIVRPKLPEATAITEANQRILAAANSQDLDDVKLRNIHDAETDLANARLAALNSLQQRRVIPNIIRNARVVGSTLILVDLAGRWWVWGALHANPTWSPAAQMLARVGAGLSTDNALPSR